MGDTKNFRKFWKKPKRPFNYELKMEELKIVGTFGLKTKRELWKARTELSRVRNQARSLLALRQEDREQKEPILMNSLSRIGLVEQNATLDDVLNLEINDLLSRRLQSIIMKKFYFKTPYQARQAISHGHVIVDDRIVNIPSYIVKVEEEEKESGGFHLDGLRSVHRDTRRGDRAEMNTPHHGQTHKEGYEDARVHLCEFSFMQ